MIKLLFTLAVIFTASFLHAQTLDPEWVRFQVTNGNGNGAINLPFSIIDSSKNVIICGNTYHPGPLTGFITTKYDSNGVWKWEKKYDWFTLDEIKSGVADWDGSIYIGGNTRNPANGLSGMLILKYSFSGDSVWSFRYQENIPGLSSSISNVHLLPNQNILISGSYSNSLTSENGGILICFSQTGEMIWESKNPDASVFDSKIIGNEIVCWGRIFTPTGASFIGWTTNMEGEILSSNITPSYTDDYQGEYHIDKKGNMYIGDFAGEYKVTKFTPKGELEWTYSKPYIEGPTPFFVTARAQGIATDEEGNLWFSGSYYIDSLSGVKHFTTFLNNNGQLIWEHILSFPPEYIGSDVSNGYFYNGKYSILGGYTINLSQNHFTYYIAQYNKNGYLTGGVSTQAGMKNSPRHLNEADNSWYATGIAEDSIFTLPTKQYLAKIKIPEAISLTASPSAIHKRIAVIPNPAPGFTQISFEQEGGSGTGIFHFIDRSGRVCLTKITPVYTGENSVDITELAALPAGWYAIKVVLPGGRIYSGQVVKQ